MDLYGFQVSFWLLFSTLGGLEPFLNFYPCMLQPFFQNPSLQPHPFPSNKWGGGFENQWPL